YLTLGVKRRAAPVHSPRIARNDQRATDRWRREDSLGPQPLHPLAALAPIKIGHAPCLIGRQRLRHQGRRQRREGLGGGGRLAASIGLRNRFFDDGKHRRSGQPIENKQLSALGTLHHRGNFVAAVSDGGEQRLRGIVVVPQIVVGGLEVPRQAAGLSV